METIASGFVGEGLSNKARKWHLWAMMTTEAKRRKDQYKPIYFIGDDFSDIDWAHDDPMVISALVHNFLVKRILVDQISSIDILYSHIVEVLGLEKVHLQCLQ